MGKLRPPKGIEKQLKGTLLGTTPILRTPEEMLKSSKETADHFKAKFKRLIRGKQ